MKAALDRDLDRAQQERQACASKSATDHESVAGHFAAGVCCASAPPTGRAEGHARGRALCRRSKTVWSLGMCEVARHGLERAG